MTKLVLWIVAWGLAGFRFGRYMLEEGGLDKVMSWADWYALECVGTEKVLFNWAFLICAFVVSKLIADWVTKDVQIKEKS